jgi:TolB-like protein
MGEPHSHSGSVYRFDGFRLDGRRRLLSCEPDGRPVPLSPRALHTLLLLVERAGEMLDKSDLMKSVWPNTIVEENSLNQNISQLRRALGERPGEHRFIETVAGRGYRFVAEVSSGSKSTAEATHTTPVASAPAATPASQGRGQSVAVLPFANLTGDPSKDYLGDGIAEELIHTLTRIPGFKIPARTSSFAYRGRDVDVRRIACDLGVGAVLEGSVRTAGERVRVTVQLIEGDTGFHVWSRSLERKLEDLFALQDELATEIARVFDASAASAPSATPALNPEAYLFYLRAKSVTLTYTEQNVRTAIDLLQRSIALDPGFAPAFAALAELYTNTLSLGFEFPDALAAAERSAEQALALDPELADVHVALGIVNALRGRWLESAALFHTAKFLSGYSGVTLYRTVYLTMSVGHIRQSLRDSEQSLSHLRSMEVPNPTGALMVAMAHVLLGNDAGAQHYVETALSLGAPPLVPPMADIRGHIELRAGRSEAAAQTLIETLDAPMQTAGGAEAVRLMCKALTGAESTQKAAAALQRVEAQLRIEDLDQLAHKRFIGWYAMLGALDLSYAFAARALDHDARSGTVGSAWAVLWLPELRAFRADPRFQTFAARLGLLPFWEQYGPPDGGSMSEGRVIFPV